MDFQHKTIDSWSRLCQPTRTSWHGISSRQVCRKMHWTLFQPPIFGRKIILPEKKRAHNTKPTKKKRPPTSPPSSQRLISPGDFATRRLHRSDGGTAAALEEFPRLQWMERVGIGVDRGELWRGYSSLDDGSRQFREVHFHVETLP